MDRISPALSTIVHIDQPWFCHMLTVFLASFILARLIRPRWLAMVLALAIGLVTAWAWGHVRLLAREWFDAWYYWNEVVEILRPGIIRSDPMEYLGVLAFCWVAPVLMAGFTVKLRTAPAPPSARDLPDKKSSG